MDVEENIQKIDLLKKEIDELRPIDIETEKRIMQKFRLDWNFHSNNLEGNSLTFGETKSFLLHGITAEGKPLKDHLDLKGHNEAILLLDDIIKNKRPLTEAFIRELHEIILHEPYERPAITPSGEPSIKRIEIGRYKKTPNHVQTVTGEIFYFATPEETPALMNDLMDWFENVSNDKKTHALTIASEFHYKFIRIHPFDDGNGRIARIIMNLILMKSGFPPVIIKTQEKKEYFQALQVADGGNISSFTNYVGEQLINSLQLFLRGARGEDIEESDDIDKRISLLKIRLEQESQKIIYDSTTILGIFEESIEPLLKEIFAKLNQFDELFFKKTITCYSNSGSEQKMHNRGSTPNSVDAVKIIKRLVTQSGVWAKMISFDIHWDSFLKTEDKEFSVKVKFSIDFSRIEFNFMSDNLNSPESSFKIFYHRKNDQGKFQKIASILANKVLSQISEQLGE